MSTDIENNPGLILRAAREERGLSIEQVADKLHLRFSVVQSMENEAYDDFSSSVFLKGYFRSYCRLVNLHEERMVELLESRLSSREKEIEAVALNAKKEKKAKFRKKFSSVAIVLGCVAGLSFFVLSYLISSGGDIAPTTTGERQTAVHESPDKVNNIDLSDVVKRDVTPEFAESSIPLPSSKNAAETLASENKRVVADQQPLIKDGQSFIASKERTEQNLSQEPLDKVSQEQPQNPVLVKLQADFTGDCWFKLTNGDGKTVYASLKRKGDKVSYEGPAPFGIVLGDARQVKVQFNGTLVDLEPHTASNGRAQITLPPAS